MAHDPRNGGSRLPHDPVTNIHETKNSRTLARVFMAMIIFAVMGFLLLGWVQRMAGPPPVPTTPVSERQTPAPVTAPPQAARSPEAVKTPPSTTPATSPAAVPETSKVDPGVNAQNAPVDSAPVTKPPVGTGTPKPTP